jgi:two-component system response regulator FlrC
MLIQGKPIIGANPKLQKAIEMGHGIASTKIPVLVVGESGTGKKTLCEMMHLSCGRKDKPFIVVDCAREITDVQNDILGHRNFDGKFVKGAIERANGGSVVFSNIDALDEAFQKKLFTILTELGDYDLDVRLMATTSKNLSKYVGAGRFYRALYVLFSAQQIVIPPLRERKEDISGIISYYVDYYSNLFGLGTVNIDGAVMHKLESSYWTHNVSELMISIENAVRNCNGHMLDLFALESGEKRYEGKVSDDEEEALKLMTLRDAEKLLIKKALIHTSENRTQAAKILGVSIRTLRNKINEYRSEGAQYFVNLR